LTSWVKKLMSSCLSRTELLFLSIYLNKLPIPIPFFFKYKLIFYKICFILLLN